MTISIYHKYKIKHTCTYSYESFDYEDLQTATEVKEFEMDGGEFLEKIVAKGIQDRDFSEIHFGDGEVYIGCFDPNTGHTSDHIYKLKPIEE